MTGDTGPEWSELEVLKAIGTQLRILNRKVETIRVVAVCFLLLTVIGGVVVLVSSQS